jgi:hypothetical protein
MVTIGLLLVLIILLFRSDGGDKQKVSTTEKPLTSYSSTTAETRMTVDGIINYTGEHRSIRITVGRDQITYEVMKGYEGEVVTSKTYDNNQAAYNNFLSAIGRAGFTKGDKSSALKNEKGYCPLGKRYVFELRQDGEDLERYWITNCSSTPKTFKGNASLNIQLFQLQVPDYNDLAGQVDLN